MMQGGRAIKCDKCNKPMGDYRSGLSTPVESKDGDIVILMTICEECLFRVVIGGRFDEIVEGKVDAERERRYLESMKQKSFWG